MKLTYIILTLSLALTHLACTESGDSTPSDESVDQTSKELAFEAVNFEQFSDIFKQQDDILYVINFWATWCKPCIEELPHFMEVKEEMSGDKHFKMVLVSMDQASMLETKVRDFMTEHEYEVDLYLLDDVKNMNTWIPQIDPSWSGAIPATVFYKNGKPVFFKEGQMTKSELKTKINQLK